MSGWTRRARVVRHVARTRWLEVAVLQASPLLGAWLGGLRLDADDLPRASIMMLGSLALTAHVFVVNDWAGHATDAHDPRRAGNDRVTRRDLGQLAVALLAVAAALLAAADTGALLLGAGIAALSAAYSCGPVLSKATPFGASVNHVTGGILHFLMGYTLVRDPDAEAAVLSLVFGLVFAAGHLNQEVRDREADRAAGLRTSAVLFGPRRVLVASFALFTAAYGLLLALAATDVLPGVALATGPIWVAHAAFTRQALRRESPGEAALRLQRRYRVLFAIVGVLLLVR